jgi:hypothetical protein
MTQLLARALQAAGGGFPVAPMGRMGEPAGGVFDYVVVVLAVIVVIVTTVLTVWWLIWPGEDAPDHIKRLILEDECSPRRDR